MVTSAALLLREHGVAGTSVAKVLEHSRGPRGSVGFHFPGGKAELISDALRWTGGLVTASLRTAAEEGASPADVFTFICEHYRSQLADSDYVAGCPVGAVAQEAYGDPNLGPVVSEIVEEWAGALADVLVRAGHRPAEAADLAMLSICSLEGAIAMARVQRSTHPLDVVLTHVLPLLERP
jgi:AcrR family transcriptional regulator